eukprot:TRINITY_DN666_c0_g1_i1.p1 TRINITY_DN666_c0_g1~~TRINITY_DN666_c0_g1_i1.p1  ORF type:complete len:735 (+),score=183.88 TRINITY_DN666_c0_g1_i1:24-2228(+)
MYGFNPYGQAQPPMGYGPLGALPGGPMGFSPDPYVPQQTVGKTGWQPIVHSTPAQQIIFEAQQRGGLWEDNDFPATVKSLGKSFAGVQWKRPREFCSYPQLFVGGTDEGDVIQGALGDCWFLGALAVVATRIDLIKEIVVSSNPQFGFYQFRFFKSGEWREVTIDDRIPCVQKDGKWRPAFAQCKDINELWVPLIEKAFAKLHGSYFKLEAGFTDEGFVDLTGGCQEVILVKDHNSGKFNSRGGLWGVISRCLHEGWLLGTSCNGGREEDDGSGILTGHAYSILEARELGPNLRLLKIRNPWGKKEWTGRWSDKSREWTPELKYMLNHKDANDGTFWMQYEDYIKHYTHIQVCRMYTDDVGEKYFRYLFKDEWKGKTAGGCGNHGTWVYNPQYGLVIYQATNVIISLAQEDVRMLEVEREPFYIAFSLFRNGNCQERIRQYKTGDVIEKSGQYSPRREVILEILLQPGQYTIVPTTYDPNEEAKFVLTVYSNQQITLNNVKLTGEIQVTPGNPLDKNSAEQRGGDPYSPLYPPEHSGQYNAYGGFGGPMGGPMGGPGGYGAPQGGPGGPGYGAPQGGPGGYGSGPGYGAPQGGPGGYGQPPMGGPGGYGASQGGPGGYGAPQGGPGGYGQPPMGGPGGYGAPQGGPSSYGAPQGFGAPQGGPGGYGQPPMGGPGSYGPLGSSAGGYGAPHGGPGGYGGQPPMGGPGGFGAPQGGAGGYGAPQGGPGGYNSVPFY